MFNHDVGYHIQNFIRFVYGRQYWHAVKVYLLFLCCLGYNLNWNFSLPFIIDWGSASPFFQFPTLSWHLQIPWQGFWLHWLKSGRSIEKHSISDPLTVVLSILFYDRYFKYARPEYWDTNMLESFMCSSLNFTAYPLWQHFLTIEWPSMIVFA